MKLILAIASLFISLSAIAQNQTDGTQTSAPVAVQPMPESRAEVQSTRPIEEIEVTSRRTFNLLRRNIRYAEEKLFVTFNELNTDDDFDVRCRKSHSLDVIRQKRVCHPAFFDAAIAEDAKQYTRNIDFGGVFFGMGMTLDEIRVQEQEKFEKLEATMVMLAEEHDSLRNEILEWSGLKRDLRERKDACMKQPAVFFLLRRC